MAIIASACAVNSNKQLNDDDSSSGPGAGSGGTGTGFDPVGSGGGTTITDPPCNNTPDQDGDNDGWTGAQGDCNDCTHLMNPGAYDYAGNNIDEDCNGTPDDTVTTCDGALPIDSVDGMDGARAMGLCTIASGEHWGVVSAEYIHVDGTPGSNTAEFHLGHGILNNFGSQVVPQEGGQLFAVSSGAARDLNDAGYQSPGGYDKGYTTGAAPGFPKESPACPGVTTGEAHDSIALRLRIKTPTNALSLAFAVNMYTFEFPVYICSEFNDFVTAIMSPAPSGLADGTCGGTPCGNISFDSQGNPLSVNAGFLEVCDPQSAGGKNFPCALGSGDLLGTGFGADGTDPAFDDIFPPSNHAATGWLQTSAPIADPGQEILLELGAYDSGDGVLDTTGLFDKFEFLLDETPTETTPIETPK
ncbi:MAG: hypothetical protein KC731_23635 [Myxococcales bacterium]|nr:hypothetical protein [Myxococcales bacterium]